MKNGFNKEFARAGLEEVLRGIDGIDAHQFWVAMATIARDATGQDHAVELQERMGELQKEIDREALYCNITCVLGVPEVDRVLLANRILRKRIKRLEAAQ